MWLLIWTVWSDFICIALWNVDSCNAGKPIFSIDIHPDGSRFATGGQGKFRTIKTQAKVIRL